ncbi:MAG: GNAT family N-acetyltransferase [Alphaproteobacteria bacterium]|nr:GNAT family N-acetyltransferase [Alphaproteobacteria bacterium]
MTRPVTRLRAAVRTDCDEIVAMVRELAEYERLLHEVEMDTPRLEAELFCDRPVVEAVVAEIAGEGGAWRHAGVALFTHNFSTFVGRRGLYLEDLFVRPRYRGLGLGLALLRHLARLCQERQCGRLEWSVLDWNEPAIGFYRAIGARPMDGWTVNRLDRDGIARLAAMSSATP